MSPLDHLLESYRAAAGSERDKGTAFEKLVAVWLVTDEVQATRFAHVHPWSVWAARQKLKQKDTGIDLVGTLRDGRFVAIQCKFFAAESQYPQGRHRQLHVGLGEACVRRTPDR